MWQDFTTATGGDDNLLRLSKNHLTLLCLEASRLLDFITVVQITRGAAEVSESLSDSQPRRCTITRWFESLNFIASDSFRINI